MGHGNSDESQDVNMEILNKSDDLEYAHYECFSNLSDDQKIRKFNHQELNEIKSCVNQKLNQLNYIKVSDYQKSSQFYQSDISDEDDN